MPTCSSPRTKLSNFHREIYLKPHTGLVSKELHNKREPGSELTHNIDIRAQEWINWRAKLFGSVGKPYKSWRCAEREYSLFTYLFFYFFPHCSGWTYSYPAAIWGCNFSNPHGDLAAAVSSGERLVLCLAQSRWITHMSYCKLDAYSFGSTSFVWGKWNLCLV